MRTERKRADRGTEKWAGEPADKKWLLTSIPTKRPRRRLLMETYGKITSAGPAVGEALKLSIGAGLMLSLVLACSTKPPARMDAYLGASSQEAQAATVKPSRSSADGLTAGLVVINDTTANDSAPPLSSQGLTVFTDQVRTEIEQALPIKIVKVLPPTGIKPDGRTEQFVAASREAGSGYLLLALLSSTEMNSPSTITVEGGSESFAAKQTDNFSLVEIALVDGRTGKVLVRAQGREHATLKRPIQEAVLPTNSGDGISSGIQDRSDALRVYTGKQALAEALMYFQQDKAWQKVFRD